MYVLRNFQNWWAASSCFALMELENFMIIGAKAIPTLFPARFPGFGKQKWEERTRKIIFKAPEKRWWSQSKNRANDDLCRSLALSLTWKLLLLSACAIIIPEMKKIKRLISGKRSRSKIRTREVGVARTIGLKKGVMDWRPCSLRKYGGVRFPGLCWLIFFEEVKQFVTFLSLASSLGFTKNRRRHRTFDEHETEKQTGKW